MNAEREWPSILQFGTGATITEALVERQYKKHAKKYHPDCGGTVDDMQQLNAAKQLALKWIETERKRQEQVKLYTAQVAQVQQTQQAINQAYAYQQQQFNQWAQGMSGSQQWPDATGNAATSQQSAANPTPTTEPIKKRSKREIVGNFFRTGKWEA